MTTRPLLRALPTLALLATLGGGAHAEPTAPASAPLQDGPYAVIAGGSAAVVHDCGFYFDCERSTTGFVRAALGWRTGPIAFEAWLLRLHDTAVGDAYVARTLRLSGWGGVAASHFGASERSEWQWRLGLMSMRHERDGDGVTTGTSGLFGLGWTMALTPQAQLQLAWDLTRADGREVSTSILHLLSAGLRWRF